MRQEWEERQKKLAEEAEKQREQYRTKQFLTNYKSKDIESKQLETRKGFYTQKINKIVANNPGLRSSYFQYAIKRFDFERMINTELAKVYLFRYAVEDNDIKRVIEKTTIKVEYLL